MQRYEKYAETITTSTGKRRYSTMYYPIPERKSTDLYIITKRSDRLDLLANQYYGDPRSWIMLAKANRIYGLMVPQGIQLWIPYPYDSVAIDIKFRDKQF